MQVKCVNFRNVVLSLCVLFTVTGCIKNKVTVKVNEDGSGHILVSRIFQKGMVDIITKQMETMTMQMPANSDIPEDPFYNEKALKAEAGQFGPGVKFLKASKYDRNGAKGHVAVYEFEDINSIFINIDASQGMQPMNRTMSGGQGEMIVAEKGDSAISFELEEGDAAKLHVRVPEYPAPSEDFAEGSEDDPGKPAYEEGERAMIMQQMEAMGNPFGLTGEETRGEALKKMLSGMSNSVVVEVNGKAPDADAAHVRKNGKGKTQYVLLDINMDDMLSDDKAVQMMCTDEMKNNTGMAQGFGLDFYSTMSDKQGITIQDKDFVVTFK